MIRLIWVTAAFLSLTSTALHADVVSQLVFKADGLTEVWDLDGSGVCAHCTNFGFYDAYERR